MLRPWLKSLGIDQERAEFLNEHSPPEDVSGLLDFLKAGEELALVSDAGTPVLADPGWDLVDRARREKIALSAIPGPSALLTGLVLSGFSGDRFYFRGFLSRQPEALARELRECRKFPATQIVYETPYRYKKLLRAMARELGNERPVFLGLNLTMPREFHDRRPLKNWVNQLEELPKAPPVIIF